MQPVKQAELADQFERRGPWVTKFFIDGKSYGGNYDAVNDTRLAQFFHYFPNARKILELGALEGGHSLGLAEQPSVERVLAIEGRASNIDKARFVQKLLRADKIEFMQANLEGFALLPLGTFDAVFCSGLLYHLPEPWKLIEQCAHVSASLFLWTHYAGEDEVKDVVHGLRGRWHPEGGLADALSGLSKRSFWPTLGSLITLLTKHGFSTVHVIENNLHHPNGHSVTLAATKA